MLKIIGVIMICGGSTAVGLSAANRLSLRIRVINEWLSIFDIMHSEIKFLLTPVGELINKCAESVSYPLKRFFDECIHICITKRDDSFAKSWCAALKNADYLELNGAEKQILLDLGNTLGRYDANEQAIRIEHLRGAMQARAKAAENERTRLGKLYSSLGVACGVALIIVFI